MNFDDTPQEAAFRAEAKAWIAANAPHVRELAAVPGKISTILETQQERITQLAHWRADTRSVLFELA